MLCCTLLRPPVSGKCFSRNLALGKPFTSISVNGSWKAILTSDNPRNEEPMDIINDMLDGLNSEQKMRSLTIVDRREAIKTACTIAQKGDVVLIAGKGHEDYQIIKGVKYHFDDKEEVRKAVFL